MTIVLPNKECEKLSNRISLHYKINYGKSSPIPLGYIGNGFLTYKHMCFMVGRLLHRHYNGGK